MLTSTIKKIFCALILLSTAIAYAGSPVIFSGDDVLTLKPSIDLFRNSKIISGALDPTVTAVDAPAGSIYLSTGTASLYVKQDSGSTTNWLVLSPTGAAWLLAGNAGTTPGTDFLGTTDAQDLVFKTNNNEWFRILSTGELATQLPANLFTYTDPNGYLTVIPGWNVALTSSAYTLSTSQTYVVPPDGTPNTIKIYSFDNEFNAANNNTDQGFYGASFDSHFDRSNSGGSASNITGIVENSSIEGSGNVVTHNALVVGQNLQGNSGGMLSSATGVQLNTAVGNLYTVGSYSGINSFLGIDPGANVNNASLMNVTMSGNITGSYVGANVASTGNITGSAFGIVDTMNGNTGVNATMFAASYLGNIGGAYEGASIALTGDATLGFRGLNVGHNAGNTGSSEGVRVGLSNGTATSKSGYVAIMGDGVTSGGGKLFDGTWGDGDYNDRIGFQINGGTGDVTTNDTAFNASQSSGTVQSFTGANIIGSGTSTSSWTGVSVAGNGNQTSVKGLDINLSGMTTTTPKTGLSINDGRLNSQSNYDTSIYPPSPAFGDLNSIGGSYVVASGFPVTGSAFIANNLISFANFQDDMGPDAFGGFLGYTYVGYLAQLAVASGKTVNKINGSFSALSVPFGSGGAIIDADMYATAGVVPAGGSVAITNTAAFHALSPICTLATNCWGVKIDAAGADNSFAKNLLVGTTTPANASVGIEISSTAKAFLNARMTTTARDALTPLEGMQIANLSSNNLEYYNGATWITATASSGSTSLTNSHIFVGNASNVATDVPMSGDITITSAGVTAIGVNKVLDSMIRQSAGLTVIGRSANTTGNVADITATADSQILRRSGTVLGFGSIDLSQANAVGASVLPVANGGTGQSSYTDGQLLIGNSTGNTLTKASLTQSVGITITAGSGSIAVATANPSTAAIAASDIDWSTYRNVSGLYTKTLGANTTFTFSQKTAGQTIIVRLTNTASNYTVTWPTVKWTGGAAPVMTVGAKSDVYTFVYDGTDVFGSYVQDMY